MLKKIALGIAILLAVFAVVVSMQPDEFRISRTATMAAPAEEIFALVNEQRKWETWSPWAKIDPNAKFTFEGPDAGVGSISRWEGNMEVGAGSSTIIESRPYEFIQFKLDFLKPMQGTNTAEFSFKPEGDKTVVSWTMYGESNFISKAMGLIFNCQKMVSDQFDKGLANLKATVES